MKDASVVVDSEAANIEWMGESSAKPDIYGQLENIQVPVLMPGLWDCHVHFLGSQQMSIDTFSAVPQALAGARGARDVAAVLNAGYTSVRELAGYGVELARAIQEGHLIGPKIYSAAAPLSQTGGHGDAHGTSLACLKDAINHGLPLCICDGPDECRRAVRLQIRKGAQLIKVFASGGVVSEIDNPIDQQFADAELRTIVEEAGRANRIVAAHCHGKEGIMAALRAGCLTIEHGSYLDDEALAEMRERGAILIATRSIVHAGLQAPGVYTPQGYKKLQEIASFHEAAYKKAVAAGVQIALGSDLGVSIAGSIAGHGRNGQELGFAVDAGMTPLQAIEASTANGPATLGPQAPLSGQIKKGYDADLIALSANALADINILADPKNVTHVWRAGKLLKSPEAPIFITSP